MGWHPKKKKKRGKEREKSKKNRKERRREKSEKLGQIFWSSIQSLSERLQAF